MNIPEEYWLKDNENISPISTINKLKTLNKVEISELQRPKLQNVKEVKTKILNANDNFLKSFDYQLNEILGKHHDIFCEESFKNSNEYKLFWQKLNEGKFDSAQYLRIGKNKKEILGVSEVLVILETPCFFVDGRKRCMEMIGIIIGGAAVVIAVSLYCCIRVGAEEDRRLEELDRRAKQDAEESG